MKRRLVPPGGIVNVAVRLVRVAGPTKVSLRLPVYRLLSKRAIKHKRVTPDGGREHGIAVVT